MKIRQFAPAALLFSSLALGQAATAATLQVDQWGEDTPECGSKAAPCRTIQHTITFRANPNDKVVVGPGYYEETVVIDQNSDGEDLARLKLESRKGYHTTIIRTAAPDTHGIYVQQPHVRIGRKGKGFTVGGADSAGYAAIRVDSGIEKVRVEGNRTILSHLGIFAYGANAQVRHNLAEYNQVGIQCVHCVDGLVRDNESRRNVFNGYVFNVSDGISVQRNKASFNGTRGFNVSDTTDFAKLQHNVSELNSQSGFMLNDVDATTVQSNIAFLNQANGFSFQQDALTEQPKITHNMAVANELRGIEFYDLIDGLVESNTAVSNQYGFRLNAGASAETFRRNNTVASSTGCAIHNQSGSPLHVESHYYGSASGPDDVLDGDNHDGLCGADPSGDGFSTKLNRTNARKALRL